MERVLQFGTGRFLRGFVEAFIDDIERSREAAGQPPGRRVTVVETSGSGMAGRLASQGHAYELRVLGLREGALVDTSRMIGVIDRSVDASEQLHDVVAAALDPDLTMIVSNTTEQGYAPGRFPRLLAAVLAARARALMPGVVILPCELIERNGDQLRRLVSDELALAQEEPAIAARVEDVNWWATTMVDRIVTAAPPGASDAAGGLGVVVEPFASWVIEVAGDVRLLEHPSVARTTDVTPHSLRKIRILNGAHTALVAQTRGAGFEFVREAVEDPRVIDWLEGLLRDEVVPALADRIPAGGDFVTTVLERLRNPYLDHRLADIATNHGQKLRLRLLPTHDEYVRLRGHPPRRLAALLSQEGVLA